MVKPCEVLRVYVVSVGVKGPREHTLVVLGFEIMYLQDGSYVLHCFSTFMRWKRGMGMIRLESDRTSLLCDCAQGMNLD